MSLLLALILALGPPVQAAASRRGPSPPGAGRVVAAPALAPSLPGRDVLVLPAAALAPAEAAHREAAMTAAPDQEAVGRLDAGLAAGRVEAVSGAQPEASGAARISVFSGSAAWDRARSRGDADAEAARLTRQDRIKPYLKENASTGLYPAKHPLTNYFLYWTKEQQDLQRLYRDFVMTPMTRFAAMFSPRNMPYVPGEEFNPFAAMARHQGEQARKFLKVLEFVKRVEAAPPAWATENEVIMKRRSFNLRDFKRPDGKPVDARMTPKLILPPNSGHLSTIADYEDGKSIVQTALAQGGRTLAMEWKSATSDDLQMIDDMVQDVVDAIDAAGGRVQLVGLCQGGWLAAMVAARYPEKVEAVLTAGSPIDAARGDNDITRVSKKPMEFFNGLVHSMGRDNIYDGETQLLAFLNSGPDGGRAKRVDFWRNLMENIDDEEYVQRAELFARWFHHVNHLSLWFLEAVDKLFRKNDLYEGRFVVHGRKVDLAKIRVPVVALEGSKDDITPSAQASKSDLTKLAGPGAWNALKRGGYIADEGEGGVNRKAGSLAVVLDKSFTSSFEDFAADRSLAGIERRVLRSVYDHLRSRGGQNFALLEKLRPEIPSYRRMLPNGHIGLYNSAGAQAYWDDAFRWVQAQRAK